jgi:hypothetical protein
MHRLHPSVAILATEVQDANRQQRPPDLSKLTVEAIVQRCKSMAIQYPLWPRILVTDNLERNAMKEHPKDQWWISPAPVQQLDDDGEDEIMEDNGEQYIFVY